jgi:hypothetical protein
LPKITRFGNDESKISSSTVASHLSMQLEPGRSVHT